MSDIVERLHDRLSKLVLGRWREALASTVELSNELAEAAKEIEGLREDVKRWVEERNQYRDLVRRGGLTSVFAWERTDALEADPEDIVKRLRKKGCPVNGLPSDGEECGNLFGAAADEIELLRKTVKKLHGDNDVVDDLTALERENAALREQATRLKDFMLAKEKTVGGLKAEIDQLEKERDEAALAQDVSGECDERTELERLRQENAQLQARANAYLLDAAGIESRAADAVELVELRAEVEHLNGKLAAQAAKTMEAAGEAVQLLEMLEHIAANPCERPVQEIGHPHTGRCYDVFTRKKQWCWPCFARYALRDHKTPEEE
jgi:DNA repair exonuclease SbcCD ATPase subunit